MSAEEEQQVPVPVLAEEPQEKIIEEKIYIGNVDYNLTEEELAEFLKDYEVESLEVPKKKAKRKGEVVEVGLGYAFATFKTIEEAKKATLELNDKEFKGRKVYTKVALPDSLRPKRVPATKPAAGKKTKAKKTKKPLDLEEELLLLLPLSDPETTATNGDSKPKTTKPKKTSRRKSSSSNTKPKPKPKTNKVPLNEGIPSKDTIFIHNLDFEVSDKELLDFYKEFEPTWVDIPKKTLASHVYRTLKRQNVPIRGRGIGFVRFASEEKQKEAVEKTNGKEFKGRAISVTIAIDSNIKPESSSENGKENEVEAKAEEVDPATA